jgi:hypothetical protein
LVGSDRTSTQAPPQVVSADEQVLAQLPSEQT